MPRLALRGPGGIVTLAALAAVSASLVGAQAPPPEPSPIEQATARIVATLLERGHISKPKINDEIAERWAKNYIKSFDPLKYNFLKADVDELMTQADTLDDKVKEGDVSFATKVFERFLKRSDERLQTALEVLKQKPDFGVEESIDDDPDRVDYPATADAANERLRKLLKLDLLRLKVAKVDEAEAVKRLTVRYKDLNRFFHNFDSGDILERYLTELAESIDPHSAYMQAESLEDMMNQTLHLSLQGIGAELMIEDGFPVVKNVVPGGAADKDGRLQNEDKIVGIESEDGTKDDFYGKKLSDIVRKIRGPAGTKVRIMVQPGKSSEIKVYEMVREKIDLKEQHAKSTIIETKGDNEKPLKIGILRLPSFYGDSMAVANNEADAVSATTDCRKMLEDFKKQGVDAVVVDLRMNGGGLLTEAISLSGLFIDKGPVVQVRDPMSVKQLEDEDAGTAWDGPMAVIIDHTSASASEIFAGVIRDYDRGLILGDSSTYGKGTVQSIIPLNERLNLGQKVPDLGALRLTIQQFYRPDGESTQVKGVTPHLHLPSFLDYQDIGEGKSDTALKFGQVPAVPHDQYNRTPADLVDALVKRSEARRGASPKFQEQQAAIGRFMKRKERHQISLNEKTFRDEMAANEVDEEEASQKDKDKDANGDAPKPKHTEKPVWEANFYNDEIIHIMADYVSLGGATLTAGPVHPAAAASIPPVPSRP